VETYLPLLRGQNIQHNDTQHNIKNTTISLTTLSKMTLDVLGVVFNFLNLYAECHLFYRYAENRGAVSFSSIFEPKFGSVALIAIP